MSASKKKVERIKDLIKVQINNITDDYMAGLYNGLVTALYAINNNEDAIIKMVEKNSYTGKWIIKV